MVSLEFPAARKDKPPSEKQSDESATGRLTVDSADKKWPLGGTVLFVVVSSLVLWIGIYFAVRSLF